MTRKIMSTKAPPRNSFSSEQFLYILIVNCKGTITENVLF